MQRLTAFGLEICRSTVGELERVLWISLTAVTTAQRMLSAKSVLLLVVSTCRLQDLRGRSAEWGVLPLRYHIFTDGGTIATLRQVDDATGVCRAKRCVRYCQGRRANTYIVGKVVGVHWLFYIMRGLLFLCGRNKSPKCKLTKISAKLKWVWRILPVL